MAQKIPFDRIIAGSVVPVGIFYFCRKADMALEGAICASVWCVLVMAYYLARRKTWDAFSTVGGFYAVAELITVLLTSDPDWYLFSPIVFGASFGLFFLLSIAVRRPMLRYFAEQTVGIDAFPEHIRESRHYVACWDRVTCMWASVYLCKAGLLAALLVWTTLEVYLSARAVLGWPVMAGLLAFSFWYPRSYWEKQPELVRPPSA
ncbi:VC0807 family protein [Salidesulfovibrio onnuriiensis]|uniref:VC0807 family protein n=1 Tax=Salidesulfovibrio onnuriiensis TaxID=2583823 RepID=UPI0011CAD75D|nr:VC0807 family protein [Salidesulfovibrio onnuriiensis]